MWDRACDASGLDRILKRYAGGAEALDAKLKSFSDVQSGFSPHCTARAWRPDPCLPHWASILRSPTTLILPMTLGPSPLQFDRSAWSAFLATLPTYLLLLLQRYFQESFSEPQDWSGFLVFILITMGAFPRSDHLEF